MLWRQIQTCERTMHQDDKMRYEDAWNSTSVELAAAAMAHIRHFVVKTNAKALREAELSPEVRAILTDLFKVLAFSWMQTYFGDFLRHTSVQVIKFHS